jgi:hypothetical protein
MNPIVLKIELADGTTKEVSTSASDLIAFEERFDMSIAALEKNFRMTHLFFLAWQASKRTGLTTDEFDAWVDTVNMVTIGDVKK